MENPLWKKLQNDPALLKQFQQHQKVNNGLESSDVNKNLNGVMDTKPHLNGEANGDTAGVNKVNEQQQQPQAQPQNSYLSNLVESNTNQQLHQIQQLMNLQNNSNNIDQFEYQQNFQMHSNKNGSSNLFYHEQAAANPVIRKSPVKRELGVVEKVNPSYGFVKCLERDMRLFFHYSSFQADRQAFNNDVDLKVGDMVEFEEEKDKRNNKVIATNIRKFQQNNQLEKNSQQYHPQQANPVDSLNLFNLKELLKQNGQNIENGTQNNFYNNNNQQPNLHSIMNGLKMLNMHEMKNNEHIAMNPTGPNGALNPAVLNLFNKENIYNNNMNQINANNNLLNMVKSQATANAMNNMEGKKVSSPVYNGNEQMEGTIAIVANKRPITSQYNRNNYNAPQLDGRITYQRSGETFYIPYSLSDVIGNSPQTSKPGFNQSSPQLKIGDRVRFLIAQSFGNEINVPAGTYYARRVELLAQNKDFNPMKANDMPRQVYRGIITTLKESFGKIEREDLFKETFFHFHEYQGQNPNQELKLGLNVEFELQDRYGKEIACNVRMLPDGTVSFDELTRNVYIGRIIQPLTKLSNVLSNTNLNGLNLNEISSIGRLIFDNNNNSDEPLTELIFSDLDRIQCTGEYTLLEGDFVQFRIATDKRKKNYANNTHMHRQDRATQITLIEEHSLVENSVNTNEFRERGVLVKLDTIKEFIPNMDVHSAKAKYGAIKCMEQNELIYFSLSEVINYVRFSCNANNTTYSVKEINLQIGDSLEFSVVKCPKDSLYKTGLKGIRVKQLPKNSVKFEMISNEFYTGVIEREHTPSSNSDKNLGLIRFDYKNGTALPVTKSIGFVENDQFLRIGDKVQFNLSTCIKSKKQFAVNIKILEACKEQGLITMLKDNFGFVELASVCARNQSKAYKAVAVPREILFHFSSVQSPINELDIGDEVEFIINRKNRADQIEPTKMRKNRGEYLCAESITKLKSATIKPNHVSSTLHKGRIVQQLRSHSLSSITNMANYLQEHQQISTDAYYGKVLTISSKKDNEATYEFGLCGLLDKKKCFQVGDIVSFQIGSLSDGVKRAFNVQSHQQQQQSQQDQSQRPQRGNNDTKKGKIESMKGHCGFIEYIMNSNNDLKKVFFHISDLCEGSGNNSESSNVKIGDEVEFILSHNSRSGKYSAIKIKKTNSSKGPNGPNNNQQQSTDVNTKDQQEPVVAKRPEHLITKLKIGNIDDKSGKQLILIRQPSKPDGKSFQRELFKRMPGSLEPNEHPEVTGGIIPAQETANISPLSIMDLIIANSEQSN